MNKIICYIDCDGILTNSLLAMANTFNKRHNPRIPITPNSIYTWNASEALIGYSPDDIEHMFGADDFWLNMTLYDGIYDTIKHLHESNKFDIRFLTIGTSENLSIKTLFLKEKFPFVDKQILICKNSGAFPGKEEIQMSNAIFVDDSQHNLFTSDAKYKVMCAFDGKKQWNSEWPENESVATTPEELYQELMAIWKLENREAK
jgi:5'(3')-deoxyribonucleotidase